MKVHLLGIDPQRDFCEPAGKGGGALFVPGAVEDMQRISDWLLKNYNKIDDIHITLDSHHLFHVAHSIAWRDTSGKHPGPFTIISEADVNNGTWSASLPGLQKAQVEYVRGLAKSGRYPLCIWPNHCLIGSSGHAVVPNLFDALCQWEEKVYGTVDYVTKGSNILTEHYSAVKAEVPDPQDPTTQINTQLIQTLQTADLVGVFGEAGSHCLANTVRDIADAFGDDSYVKKLVLLTDATSPVTGFEKLQEDFISEMTARGMQLSTVADFLK